MSLFATPLDSVHGALDVPLSKPVLPKSCCDPPPPPDVTVTGCDFEFGAPSSSVTVSVTVYVPAAAYVWLGFVAVDVPPSPKVQERDAIVPSLSLDASVKLAVSPLVVNEKFATGGWFVPPPPPPRLLIATLRITLPRPLAKS